MCSVLFLKTQHRRFNSSDIKVKVILQNFNAALSAALHLPHTYHTHTYTHTNTYTLHWVAPKAGGRGRGGGWADCIMLFNIWTISVDTWWQSVYLLFRSSSSVQVNRWASCLVFIITLHYYHYSNVFFNLAVEVMVLLSFIFSVIVINTSFQCFITTSKVVCYLIMNIAWSALFMDMLFINLFSGEYTFILCLFMNRIWSMNNICWWAETRDVDLTAYRWLWWGCVAFFQLVMSS